MTNKKNTSTATASPEKGNRVISDDNGKKPTEAELRQRAKDMRAICTGKEKGVVLIAKQTSEDEDGAGVEVASSVNKVRIETLLGVLHTFQKEANVLPQTPPALLGAKIILLLKGRHVEKLENKAKRMHDIAMGVGILALVTMFLSDFFIHNAPLSFVSLVVAGIALIVVYEADNRKAYCAGRFRGMTDAMKAHDNPHTNVHSL